MEVENFHQLESFVAKDSSVGVGPFHSDFEFESSRIFNTEYLNTEMEFLTIYLPMKLMLHNFNNLFLPFIFNVRCQKWKKKIKSNYQTIQLSDFQGAQN